MAGAATHGGGQAWKAKTSPFNQGEKARKEAFKKAQADCEKAQQAFGYAAVVMRNKKRAFECSAADYKEHEKKLKKAKTALMLLEQAQPKMYPHAQEAALLKAVDVLKAADANAKAVAAAVKRARQKVAAEQAAAQAAQAAKDAQALAAAAASFTVDVGASVGAVPADDTDDEDGDE